MANKERGEFTLYAGEQRYTLQLTTNACCELEDFCGRSFDQIQKGAERGFAKDLRLIVWAALWEKHPDISQPTAESLKAIGEVMDAAGGIRGMHLQIKLFLLLNADSGEKAEKGSGKANPRLAQDGTGASSTLTRSVAT